MMNKSKSIAKCTSQKNSKRNVDIDHIKKSIPDCEFKMSQNIKSSKNPESK